MRFYRLEFQRGGGYESNGFEFYTVRAEAEKARREHDDPCCVGTVDVVDIIPTKAGILAALREFASHPDNG